MSKQIINNTIWLFPFLSFLFGYYLINFLFRTNEVFVPNLIGKPLNQAIKILSDLNLNLRVIKEKNDSNLLSDIIIEQTPCNQIVKTNKSIYVTINKKLTDIKMPDFKGKKLDEIKDFLNKNNIKSKIYFVENNLENNICIAQYPTAGKFIDKQEKVILYISKILSKQVVMPNLKGLNLENALEFLQKYNLNPKIYNYNYNKVIVDQRPLAGSLVNLNNLEVQLQTD